MANQHILKRRFRVGVESNFERFDIFLVLKVRNVILVDTDMAAVAVGIGLRMADLALHFTEMNGMIQDRTVFQFFMTIRALSCLFKFISYPYVGRR